MTDAELVERGYLANLVLSSLGRDADRLRDSIVREVASQYASADALLTAFPDPLICAKTADERSAIVSFMLERSRGT